MISQGGQLDMMISPETYYEKHLKGKTKEQFMSAIRGLKQYMGGCRDYFV